jgi:hypothetical protein
MNNAMSNPQLRQFLQNQANHAESDAVQSLVNQIVERPDESTLVSHLDAQVLEEFKAQVKVWWELDTAIKRLHQAMRERKKMQIKLSAHILEFMKVHNIEDLNTKEGVLRYKSTYVKAPISQKHLKEKLSNEFAENNTALDIIKKTFDEREKVEKVSLRRVKL